MQTPKSRTVTTRSQRWNWIWMGVCFRGVAGEMIRCFPEREEAILANLAAYRTRIEELRDEMRIELGEITPSEVLVFHEALP